MTADLPSCAVSTDRMLADGYPALARVSSIIAGRHPAWLRDELESELLVAMTAAARVWDGRGDFISWVAVKMRWAASDFARNMPGWSRRVGRFATFETLEGFDFVDPQPSPHETLMLKERLAELALLPERLKIALVNDDWRNAAELLGGVTESRVCQLRRQARERLE